ncbi:hypothetical protein ABZV78_27305 [Micromonospora sp. NPDC004540]|uniref:hypothetical protein n=1 Tax=Micromonospora sp. NPDC004540 TaxID=3154457 RepID=UPI0033A0D3A2
MLVTVGHGAADRARLGELLVGADVAVLGRGVPVAHLMPDGRLTPHRPAEGARRLPDGHLLWDG